MKNVNRVLSLIACVAVIPVLPLLAGVPSPPALVVVEGELCNGLFILPLRWGTQGTGHELVAVFDSGGSNLMIDPDAVERASGTRVPVGKRVELDGVRAGQQTLKDFRPRVRELDHLSRALGRQVDVFLPLHPFDGMLVTLDYETGRVVLTRGSLEEPDGVETFSSAGPDQRPWIEIDVNGQRRKVLIDSGSNGAFSLSPDRGYEWLDGPHQVRLSQRMKDVQIASAGRLAGAVEVGSRTFGDPLVTLAGDPELIGAHVLRHFVVTFDQAHRRVRLVPFGHETVELPSERGTGALFKPREEGFEIAHVIEGSPADRAGLKRGDLLIRINGIPVEDRGCADMAPLEAASLRLTLRKESPDDDIDVDVEVVDLIH